MSPKFCPRKLSRICWQVLAIILVLFALVVSLFRGLLPKLDQVRAELTNYIESEYQVQVDVGELTAEWQAFGPALTVKKLVLPSQDKLPFTLVVDDVHVKLDFWESVITTSPQIETVIFEGVQVALDIDELNKPSTSSSQTSTSQAVDTDWLYRLLLEQLEHFSIRDASLQLLSQRYDYRPIYIKDLSWKNDDLRHQGKGKLYLDKAASEVEQLSLQLDIRGNGDEPESLKGQVYLAARSLDLGEWASRQADPYDSSSKLALEGVVNLEAWFDIAQRGIKSAQIEFEPSWLEWDLNGQEQHFEIKGGRMLWRPSEQGWSFNSQQLAFETGKQLWPELEFSAQKRGEALIASVNRLDASTLLPLLPLFPGVDLALLNTWQSLEPQGYISNIAFSLDAEREPKLELDVEQLSWQQQGQIPGSSPLDIQLGWQQDALYLSLPKQKYLLDFGSAFATPLAFDGEPFDVKYDIGSQALIIPQLELNNPDISVDASVRLGFEDVAHLALLADVKLHDVSRASNYFPLHGMSEDLVEYLDTGLVAGNTQDAKVLWHGPLANYPYFDHSGVFQADFTIQDAEFEFQPDWPSVTELNLSALFENARMDLLINKGNLLDVVVDGASVVIPELGERSLLQVKADLATQGEAATQVLNRSSLADSVGSTLDVVQIKGEVTAELDLSIPLYDGEREQIRGLVNFDHTPVYITEPGVALDEVTGQVSFLNDVVKGEGIEAKLFQQPVSLSFDTESLGNNYGLNLDLSGTWQLAELPDYLDNPLKSFYSGELEWDGGMTLIFDPSGYRIQAQVNSELLGVGLDLPAPFTKGKDESRKLTAELIGDNKQSSLGIKLGKEMEFWGGFDQLSGDQLAHFDLLLGRLFRPGDQLKKNQGHLQLSIAETQLTPWLPIIHQFTDPVQVEVSDNIEAEDMGERVNFFPPLVSIDGEIKQLDLMGQALTHLTLGAQPVEHVWRFKAESDEFDGRVDFYPDWSTQGLKIVASKFHMAPVIKQPENARFKSDTVLKNLPPLAVDVDEFSFYGKPLGHLVLQGTPQGNNYQIQTLSLTMPEVTLSGSGAWNNSADENLTEFNVKLNATRFDDLSTILGTDPGLKNAPVDIDAKISWQGAPYAFALDSLNGQVNFDLGKGHLTEVSDKGARIFSLFSLDSLLRKLSLDFSDVFGKGLYFNSFTGTLNIDNGVIKTRDTEMDAVAGNMKVRGYTDLTTESLNYDIRFVPQLASSVPTVVLLTTGGWTFGLGAFALTKVLEPVIEVITELRFRLTGTMSEPKIEELERKSKEIEIPESALPKTDNATEGQVESSLEAPLNSDLTDPSQIEQENPQKRVDTPEPHSQDKVDPSSGVELFEPNVQEIPTFKEVPKKEVKDADQPITMSKQPGCIGESGIYRVAA
ncbi:YhdP family protein [Shewanella woodyi]|uniref:YhdP family protein n=1 Tax=Shewanella woodyi TaxID=60961 RepID=UPI0007EA14E9|nr:YhdP family protein [Shewanella woodyi]